MTKVLVLMAVQPSKKKKKKKKKDLGTFMIRSMDSTVAKCRSHKDKRLLFVYTRKEKINNLKNNNWRLSLR